MDHKTRLYKNVKFVTSLSSLLESVQRRGLIKNYDGVATTKGVLWTNARSNVKVMTESYPMLKNNSTKWLEISGTKRDLDLFETSMALHVDFDEIQPEEEEVKDSDIRADYHENLNPNVWNKAKGFYELKPDVAKKLMEIANKFVTSLELDDIGVFDIIVTGSLANYNWTDESDIDLHVLYDFAEAKKTYGSVFDKYVATKGKLWNEIHDISILGFPVEFYVQDKDEEHVATGMYTVLKGEWVVKPEYEEFDVNMRDVKLKANEWMGKIDALVESGSCKESRVDELMDKLRKFRKAGLSKAGEGSVENIVFKTLRGNGYIEKLANCRINSVNKELSLEDEELLR